MQTLLSKRPHGTLSACAISLGVSSEETHTVQEHISDVSAGNSLREEYKEV